MPFTNLSFPPLFIPHYLTPPTPFHRRTSSTDTNTSNTSATSDLSGAEASLPPSTSTLPDQPSPTALSGHGAIIRCSRCHADLALTSQIISKGFTGRHGRAFLVGPGERPRAAADHVDDDLDGEDALLPNTFAHKPVPRHLVTGLHTVADISCMLCGAVLGWKYVTAEEPSQRYKVGKFILETRRCGVTSCWENGDNPPADTLSATVEGSAGPKYTAAAVHALMDAAAGVGSDAGTAPNHAMQLGAADVEFDSQDEDECEELFAGTWTAHGALNRRRTRARLGILSSLF